MTGTADTTINFGFSGFFERPVAGDLNLDGVDDLGLWAPYRQGQAPREAVDWYFLVSAGPLTFTPFSPSPIGNDLYAQFGDDYALPVFGNFDPPLAEGGDTEVTEPNNNDGNGDTGGTQSGTVESVTLTTNSDGTVTETTSATENTYAILWGQAVVVKAVTESVTKSGATTTTSTSEVNYLYNDLGQLTGASGYTTSRTEVRNIDDTVNVTTSRTDNTYGVVWGQAQVLSAVTNSPFCSSVK